MARPLKEEFLQVWQNYRAPLLIFLASRASLFGILSLASAYGMFRAFDWTAWDGQHYLAIAQYGYTFHQGHFGEANGNTIAFFPLYPLAISLFHFLLPISYLQAALVASFLAGCAAACALHRLVCHWGGDKAATAAVFLFSFYPVSIFLSAPYTESLLFFLLALSLLFLEKDRPLAAGTAIGLACLTKITGFFLLPWLAYQLWRKRHSLRESAASLLLFVIPFSAFMAYQRANFGTATAFLQAERLGWGKTLDWPAAGYHFLQASLATPRFYAFESVEVAALILALLCLMLALRSIPRVALWFGACLIAACVCTNLPISITRYLICFFPFYYLWGKFFSCRPVALSAVTAALASLHLLTGIVFLLSGYVL